LENVDDNLGIDSALESLYSVDIVSVADSPEAHIASIFRVEACILWHICSKQKLWSQKNSHC
jgi:hypothetical protein